MTIRQEDETSAPGSDSGETGLPRDLAWASQGQSVSGIPGAPVVLGPADIPALVALEKLCFSVPWTAKQYETVMGNEPFRLFGIREGDELAGYLTLYAAAWEMEILNIAVHPTRRRRGYGRRMLSHVLQLCRKMGIKRGFLEVRRSNVPAQGLYRAFGFEEVGVRKRYYPDNREDAIIMRLELEAETPPEGQDP